MINFLEREVSKVFDKLGLVGDPKLKSAIPIYGDYQINGLLAIANTQGIDPRILAKQVAEKLPKKFFSKIEVTGPGFINLTLSDDFLIENLVNLLEFNAQKQRVVIDYSSPNLAKEMHVGHLRSTIIGDALFRVHEFIGNQVIKRNHVGDWGMQFGMLLAYFSTTCSSSLEVELQDLETFYCQAKRRFDEDPVFAEVAHNYVNRLQKKDPQIYPLWKQFIQISLEHCQKIYERLGVCLTPEDVWGESAYNDFLPELVNRLLEEKIAVRDRGAVCVFLTPEELEVNETTPFIIQKQDGSYLYATTDLAAAYDRIDRLKADLILYVIDARQSLHLKQLFAVLKKLGKLKHTKCQHVSFGVMLGKDNKPFKTRTGGTVKLNNLLDQAHSRALELLKLRNRQLPNLDKLAEKIGIAAIKYADLSKHRMSNYQFNFDQMLSFEGNTACYLLYALVRIRSLLRKTKVINEIRYSISSAQERNLILQLVKFKELIFQVANEALPHLLCNFLYELSTIFMRFYETCPILNNPQQDSRLALTRLTERVLTTGLYLLGIPMVDEM